MKHPGEYLNPNPVGSGPFKFGHWRIGQEIYFKANKDHFAAPVLDDFYFVSSRARMVWPGLLNGVKSTSPSTPLPPLLQTVSRSCLFSRLAYTPSHGVYEVRPDLEKKPFDDVNFRKAVYHAFDRRPFINYFGGGVAGSNTPITPLNKFWHNPNLPAPEYSIDKAKAVLKKAGYTWDSQGNLCFPL